MFELVKKSGMKTIFITGAAHGIGLATARQFANQGWYVGLYDIDREVLDQMLGSDDFPHACGAYCDVSDLSSVKGAIEHFSENTNGRMDVLVNNAGVLASGKFEEIDPATHEQIINVNIKGLTQVAQTAFPLLKQTEDSVLVNVCSASSVHGIPLLGVYSATKFYVNGLTQALHVEWAHYGIRVTAVKPPVVNTAMGHHLDPKLKQKMVVDMEPEYVAEAIQVSVAGKRIGYLLGTSARLWGLADKFLPESGRRRLVRYLSGH